MDHPDCVEFSSGGLKLFACILLRPYLRPPPAIPKARMYKCMALSKQHRNSPNMIERVPLETSVYVYGLYSVMLKHDQINVDSTDSLG